MGLGSTDFPTDIDSNAVADNTTEISSGGFNDHSIQIEAIETKVGKDSSTTNTTHDYKLSGVADGTKAVSLIGIETLTKKTLTTPLIDTISEKTTAHGVTIDSLNIKDGKLNTNNSVVTTNITDANVTLAKMAAEAWTDFSATVNPTGFSGTPTVTYARYSQIGKTIKVTFNISGTSNATTFTITLPVNAKRVQVLSPLRGQDATTPSNDPQIGATTADNATLTLYKNFVADPWTNSGTKGSQGTLIYEAV